MGMDSADTRGVARSGHGFSRKSLGWVRQRCSNPILRGNPDQPTVACNTVLLSTTAVASFKYTTPSHVTTDRLNAPSLRCYLGRYGFFL